jgi:hypothetical protein
LVWKLGLDGYPLDDHALIFGHEFIIFSKGLPLAQVGFLVSLDEDKFMSMCMMMKRKLNEYSGCMK